MSPCVTAALLKVPRGASLRGHRGDIRGRKGTRADVTRRVEVEWYEYRCWAKFIRVSVFLLFYFTFVVVFCSSFMATIYIGVALWFVWLKTDNVCHYNSLWHKINNKFNVQWMFLSKICLTFIVTYYYFYLSTSVSNFFQILPTTRKNFITRFCWKIFRIT